jgi:hypothetical protein
MFSPANTVQYYARDNLLENLKKLFLALYVQNVPKNYFQRKNNYRSQTSSLNKYIDIKHLKGISFVLKILWFKNYSRI